jgi:hypothetical protein
VDDAVRLSLSRSHRRHYLSVQVCGVSKPTPIFETLLLCPLLATFLKSGDGQDCLVRLSLNATFTVRLVAPDEEADM